MNILTIDLTKTVNLSGSKSLDALLTSYKEVGAILIGFGLIFYGLYVIRKMVTSPQEGKSSLITFIIALIVFLLLWELI